MLAAVQVQEISEVVLAIAAMLALASILAVVTRRLHIPLTLILVVIGFAAGELARSNGIELPVEDEAFHDVLIFIFLPALVFEAALTLPARVFLKHLVPILTLAIVALVISAALVGILVHFGLGISLTAALLFGVLISATDPVAVTATFRELGVPNRLLVLVEGESLLNDGIAIVLFNIFLVAALGTADAGVAQGVLDFLYVFCGGALLGAVLGLGVAELAARLGRLPSTALTVALAYGSFALGEVVFGFSGVMASVAAGLVLSAFANTLVPRKEAQTWNAFWESLGFVANAILFVLIGVVIDADLIVDNLGAIAIGVAAVVVARPLAIIPLMPLLNRAEAVPSVGIRSQVVVVWGGLRGGVALALALAIPDALPEQERFIAMTAGVVITTLVINATTLRALIKRLGIGEPEPSDHFIAAAARFDGARTARTALSGEFAHEEIDRQLEMVEGAAAEEIRRIDLPDDELESSLALRGLAVERATLEHLVENGLVPQWHARVALNRLEDQLDAVAYGSASERGLFSPSRTGRLVYSVARRIHAGRMTPEKWVEIAYRDLQARLTATRDAIAALEHFEDCPGVSASVLDSVRSRFHQWHAKAELDLDVLTRTAPPKLIASARRHYSADLGGLSSTRELRHLSELGLISTPALEQADRTIIGEIRRRERERVEVQPGTDEDVGA